MEIYEIIKVIEFNSDRKMMSVLVKDKKTQKHYLFAKGADIAIIPRLVHSKDKEHNDKELLK